MQATFEGDLRVRGRDYRLERRGDEYFGSFPLDSSDGESSQVKTVRLTQVTGSHHMQVFWYSFGDQRGLGMFPLYFHIEEQRWIPWSSVFLMRPEFHAKEDVGRWNTHCVKCHTTDARSRMLAMTPAATAAAETEVGEYGISCEACHGPGDVHAGLNRNPLRRYQQHLTDTADESIVHPTRLDAEASAHVCAQCHSVHALVPKQFERRAGVRQPVPARRGPRGEPDRLRRDGESGGPRSWPALRPGLRAEPLLVGRDGPGGRARVQRPPALARATPTGTPSGGS